MHCPCAVAGDYARVAVIRRATSLQQTKAGDAGRRSRPAGTRFERAEASGDGTECAGTSSALYARSAQVEQENGDSGGDGLEDGLGGRCSKRLAANRRRDRQKARCLVVLLLFVTVLTHNYRAGMGCGGRMVYIAW